MKETGPIGFRYKGEDAIRLKNIARKYLGIIKNIHPNLKYIRQRLPIKNDGSVYLDVLHIHGQDYITINTSKEIVEIPLNLFLGYISHGLLSWNPNEIPEISVTTELKNYIGSDGTDFINYYDHVLGEISSSTLNCYGDSKLPLWNDPLPGIGDGYYFPEKYDETNPPNASGYLTAPHYYTGLARLAIQAVVGAGREAYEISHWHTSTPPSPTTFGIIRAPVDQGMHYWGVTIGNNGVNVGKLKFPSSCDCLFYWLKSGVFTDDISLLLIEATLLGLAEPDMTEMYEIATAAEVQAATNNNAFFANTWGYYYSSQKLNTANEDSCKAITVIYDGSVGSINDETYRDKTHVVRVDFNFTGGIPSVTLEGDPISEWSTSGNQTYIDKLYLPVTNNSWVWQNRQQTGSPGVPTPGPIVAYFDKESNEQVIMWGGMTKTFVETPPLTNDDFNTAQTFCGTSGVSTLTYDATYTQNSGWVIPAAGITTVNSTYITHDEYRFTFELGPTIHVDATYYPCDRMPGGGDSDKSCFIFYWNTCNPQKIVGPYDGNAPETMERTFVDEDATEVYTIQKTDIISGKGATNLIIGQTPGTLWHTSSEFSGVQDGSFISTQSRNNDSSDYDYNSFISKEELGGYTHSYPTVVTQFLAGSTPERVDLGDVTNVFTDYFISSEEVIPLNNSSEAWDWLYTDLIYTTVSGIIRSIPSYNNENFLIGPTISLTITGGVSVEKISGNNIWIGGV